MNPRPLDPQSSTLAKLRHAPIVKSLHLPQTYPPGEGLSSPAGETGGNLGRIAVGTIGSEPILSDLDGLWRWPDPLSTAWGVACEIKATVFPDEIDG